MLCCFLLDKDDLNEEKSHFQLVPDFVREEPKAMETDVVTTFGITEKSWRHDAMKLAWNLKDIPNDKLVCNAGLPLVRV